VPKFPLISPLCALGVDMSDAETRDEKVEEKCMISRDVFMCPFALQIIYTSLVLHIPGVEMLNC
jgi:hypothetical protein